MDLIIIYKVNVFINFIWQDITNHLPFINRTTIIILILPYFFQIKLIPNRLFFSSHNNRCISIISRCLQFSFQVIFDLKFNFIVIWSILWKLLLDFAFRNSWHLQIGFGSFYTFNRGEFLMSFTNLNLSIRIIIHSFLFLLIINHL